MRGVGDTLSKYSKVNGYILTGGSVGVSSIDEKFDVSLIVKNVFDRRPHEVGWTSYEPYPYPRWAGISFTNRF